MVTERLVPTWYMVYMPPLLQIAIETGQAGVSTNSLKTLVNVLSIPGILLFLLPAWSYLPCSVPVAAGPSGVGHSWVWAPLPVGRAGVVWEVGGVLAPITVAVV